MNCFHCQWNTLDTLHLKTLPWQMSGRLLPEFTGSHSAGQLRKQSMRLGYMQGQSNSRLGTHGPWQIQRELFVSEDQTLIAMRAHLLNHSDQDQVLDDLTLFEISDQTSLSGVGQNMGDWRIVRMSRQKNDIPGNFRPGDDDMDMSHARIDGAEIKAGQGVTAADLAKLKIDKHTVRADPCLWIMARDDDAQPGLCFCMLGQTEHLSHIAISSDDTQEQMTSLCVHCEFDGVIVRPGQRRSTHWLMISASDDQEQLRQTGVQMLAAEMRLAEPTPAPSFFCSWYFYGTDFTQADLDENLAGLKQRPLPFDVLLIDNGWMTDFGCYEANERFELGMTHAAKAIEKAGYRPGIWTCPFVISNGSPILKKYPNLLARDVDGNLMTFSCEKREEHVLDPTSPDAEPYFAELYGKLTSWGYTAHKLDFLRAIIVSPRIRFADPTMTRAQAYRRGMELIRKYAGKDAYILACGGLFEGTAGLADGMRIGSDTRGHWSDPNAATAYQKLDYMARIKQNIFRNHTNRLWHTDPDAMQLRRRHEPFREQEQFFHLSEGSFTDDEAMTLLANQYIGGGAVTLCERMAELDDDRYAMLRRVLPSVAEPAQIIDFDAPKCPTMLWTRIEPEIADHRVWYTLTVFNWEDQPVNKSVPLSVIPGLALEQVMGVMELVTSTHHGLCDGSDVLKLKLPAHGVRVLRIAPWQDRKLPLLLGTDGHLSGGAGEFEMFQLSADRCYGRISERWHWPLRWWLMLDGEHGVQRVALSLNDTGKVFDFDLRQRIKQNMQVV